MNIKRLLPVILLAIFPLSASLQGSPPSPSAQAAEQPASGLPTSPAPDAAELTRLLEDFLAGASRNDAALHERFWSDDLIYTSALGRRKGKADTMREVRAEAAPAANDETSIFTAEEIRIQQYGTTAIVAFRLVGTTKKGGTTEVAKYYNTGTFLRRDGKWQAVAWQATKMPAEGEPMK